jgi:transcriptional regulator with XRE-family HTH domain
MQKDVNNILRDNRWRAKIQDVTGEQNAKLPSVAPTDQQVMEAVRSLRRALKETRAEFADRLGVSLRSVARFEGDRPPRGEVVGRLIALSAANGRRDLERIFERAYNATKPSARTELANAVRKFRNELGQTQREFAASLGVAAITVARIETDHFVTPDLLIRLSSLAESSGRTRFQARFLLALTGKVVADLASTPAEKLWRSAKDSLLDAATVLLDWGDTRSLSSFRDFVSTELTRLAEDRNFVLQELQRKKMLELSKDLKAMVMDRNADQEPQ